VFRQDCNVGLAECWDEHDAPGRIGMAEIRYVEGLLAFWDELKARFPHLLFDIVQRRDLASHSRTLDMSRSDHEFLPRTDPIASQGAQFGLSHWMPLSGTGVPFGTGNDYVCLSGLSSSFGTAVFPSIGYEAVSVDPPADYPWDWLRRMLDIHRRARPFFRGDFYPLLEHVNSNQFWGAMQFHRADLGAGMVVVYRRPDSPLTTARFQLGGMAADCSCSLDEPVPDEVSLDGSVLEVHLSEAPAAIVAFYRTDDHAGAREPGGETP
jgi:alpha-galactosidase